MDPSAATVLGVQASGTAGDFAMGSMPQSAVLELFFPGFSVVSGVVQKYLHFDLNVYIPVVILCGCMIFCWRYFSEYAWGLVEGYLMSVVDIRTDDVSGVYPPVFGFVTLTLGRRYTTCSWHG
jgi:hypothetical protein